jgi:hypothetical protein
VTELRADLAVGGDAAWIVVCRAGDEAWPKSAQKPDGRISGPRDRGGFLQGRQCVIHGTLQR